MYRTLTLCFVLLAIGCDDKKDAAGGAGAASASASAAAAPDPVAAAASASAAAEAASASAAPAGSAGTSMLTGDAKDVVLTVKDPTKEPTKTIKAAAGGSVTVFLPDYPGTVWSVDSSDKALGKAKEEVIPGFAPGTNGHQFKWTTKAPAGAHKVNFVNKKMADKAAKPSATFVLTIEIS